MCSLKAPLPSCPPVNLILFEPTELPGALPLHDPRARHVLSVLRRNVGESFDAGLINGPRGQATVVALGEEALSMTFTPQAAPPPAEPLTLVIGLPRPQTARDILRDATTLGVGALHFVRTEKSDPNYAQSTLWTSGEWRRHLINGAEQAFSTRLPAVSHGRSLAETLAGLSPAEATRLALDHYEATTPLSGCAPAAGEPVVLALGPERGWGPADRAFLRAAGFSLHHLGPRVLRTETACTAALVLVRARMGLL